MENGTQSVHNALRVVEEVSRYGPAGVSDLARRLDLPKSTVQRILTTLRSSGWLRQDARSRWALTLRCATIGRNAIRESAVGPVADPIAIELRDRTHETVRYFLVEGDILLHLGSAESDLAVRPFESDVAGASLLHATAIGRAALATMSVEQVQRILARPLKAVTPKTLIDPVALLAEIDATRERGWGRVTEDLYLDVGGVAAVAQLYEDVLVGIGISYPLHRTPEKTIPIYGELARDAITRIATAITPLFGASAMAKA
jgi:IclR family transcriptional regulator, acetate operon repressor